MVNLVNTIDIQIMICKIGSVDTYRSVFAEPQGAGLHLKVLGFHQVMAEPVRSAGFRDDWFIAVFHDAVSVELSGGRAVVQAGSLVATAPGDRIVHGGGNFSRSWVRLQGVGFDSLAGELRLRSNAAYAVADADSHDLWLTALHRECEHRHGGDGRILRDVLRAWLRSVVRKPDDVPRLGLARAARRFIEARYTQSLSLDGIASALGCSRAGLCRAFSGAYAMAPISYVRHLRMAHAEELLLSTDLAVGHISEQCGFSDLAYFSRAFSEAHGLSPSAFRAGRAAQT